MPLLDLPWPALLAAALFVLGAYTVFGATGFGSALIAVPLLAHLVPLTVAVPLITALDAGAATSQAGRQWRHVAWPEFRRLLPTMLVGIALGTTLLVTMPREPALLALGIFVAIYGSYLLSGAHKLRRAPAWLALPLGLVGGTFSVMFGTGGPVYMVFLSARIQDKAALRATSSAMVTLSVWIRITVFVVTGLLLDVSLLVTAALMAPMMIAGLVLGNRLHDALTGTGVLRLISLLLVGNGVSLIVRTLPWLRGD